MESSLSPWKTHLHMKESSTCSATQGRSTLSKKIELSTKSGARFPCRPQRTEVAVEGVMGMKSACAWGVVLMISGLSMPSDLPIGQIECTLDSSDPCNTDD